MQGHGVWLCAIVFVSCGGDDSKSEAEPDAEGESESESEGEASTAVVYGRIQSSVGDVVARAQVQTVDSKTVANEQGFFTLMLQGGSSALLQVTAEGHAPSTVPVDVPATGSTYLEITLLAFEAIQEIDAAKGGTVTTPDGASVTFSKGALAASGMVTVSLTSLNAADGAELAAFPGNFQTNKGDMLESFGAIAIDARDAGGKSIQMSAGKSATATIPTALGMQDEVPLWSFDEETGRWVQDGGMLTGCADGTCEGTLPHLSWWNADMVMETTCLRACVTDDGDRPVAGVQMVSQGVDYNGQSSSFTGVDGCVCLEVKRSATVQVSAVNSGGIAGPVTHTTATDVNACSSDTCERLSDALVVVAPKFQAILTWGDSPGDLDSHMTGPCPEEFSTSTGCANNSNDNEVFDRFHMFYAQRGSLSEFPFAFLNTDDTDGGGPEITTLTKCFEGTYRYSVHNYSGIPELTTSSARVTINLPDGSNEEYAIENPPVNVDVLTEPLNDLVWVVGELVCGSEEDCTWRVVNQLGTPDMRSYHPNQ